MAGLGTGLLMVLVVVFIAAPSLQANFDRKLQENIDKDTRIMDISDGPTKEPKKASLKQFPWQLLVHKRRNVGSSQLELRVCGGSIIDRQWILSAAHCYTELKLNGFEIDSKIERLIIYAGVIENLPNEDDYEVDVQKNIYTLEDIKATGDKTVLFIPENFNKKVKYNNDIALIKLKNILTYSDSVWPIPLATVEDYVPGKKLTASGWGRMFLNDPSSEPIKYLRYVDGLELKARDGCNSLLEIPDSMICHRTINKQTLKGDSGGPVLTGSGKNDKNNGPPFVQIGIVSWIYERAPEVGVYTYVPMFKPWIDTIKRDNSHPVCNSRTANNRCNHGCTGVNCSENKTGCPDEPGYFLITTPSRRCFRIYTNKTRNWTETKKLCQDNGSVLVHPFDIFGLRSYVVQRFGEYNVWLAGRGNGDAITWEDNEEPIDKNNPYWYGNHPKGVENTWCLAMKSDWPKQIESIYKTWDCSKGYAHALCELDMNE